MVFGIVIFLFTITSTRINAHRRLLLVDYDECESDDKLWYYLNEEDLKDTNGIHKYYHLPQDVTTIKYYFSEVGEKGRDITWNSEVSATMAEEVKTAYVNSMKKWNDVYYYTYDEDGNMTKNRIINIVEGTEEDNNLIIYPEYAHEGNFASTDHLDSSIKIPTGSITEHYHYDKWYMKVSPGAFNNLHSKEELAISYERTGAHEIGHVLGLNDIDNCCSKIPKDKGHHTDALMGYGKIIDRKCDITYKDIAGVSVTRGFHDEIDHVWMKRIEEDGTKSLICALCNGVKRNVSLDADGSYRGSYVREYKSCDHYGGTNAEMLVVAEAKNKLFVKCLYCRRIEEIVVDDTYSMGSYTPTINREISLSNSQIKYYELNVNYAKNYEFLVQGTSKVNFEILSENYNIVKTTDIDNNDNIMHTIVQLPIGKYYLKVINDSDELNTVNFKIQSRTTVYLSQNCDNDILLNNFNGIIDYYFVNDDKPGFYRFTISGEMKDGTTVTYPLNCIRVYDNENKITPMKKIDNELDYKNVATNEYGDNSMIVLLPRTGYYYLSINFYQEGLNKLILRIENTEESSNLNLFNLSETGSDTAVVFNEETRGDKFKSLILEQKGQFVISTNYLGSLQNKVSIIVIKVNYNSARNLYTFSTQMLSLLDEENPYTVTILTLDAGEYYIGYLNNYDSGSVIIEFERLITVSGSKYLITDPSADTLYGSEVRYNNGAFQGITVTIGFTRFIYFDSTFIEVPSLSRLDYDWYSSDESIATISPYGTLFGKNAGTVKIMAVHKSNPTIVFVKEFIVKKDNRIEDLTIDIVDTVNYAESGQLYQIRLTDENSPYPLNSLYDWRILPPNNYEKVSSIGTFHINNTGLIVVEGRYKLNSKVVIRLTITVK